METKEEKTDLALLVENKGLELSEAEQIKQSYLPYFAQMGAIKELAKKINFENPTELDEKIARDLRLKTVKIRTGSESVKDERKKVHVLKASLEQDAWNLIKSSCLLDEELFLQVEKKREIEEKKRKELLKNERFELIKDYTDQASMYPLGEMTEDNFNDLLSGFKLAKEAKEAAMLKAEEERIAREKSEAEEKEKMRLENEKLKAEKEETERLAAIERQKQADALAKLEAEKKAEQDRHDKLIEAQRKEAAKIKAENDAKLKKQKEETERLEKELKDKKSAEELAVKEAKAKSDKESAEKLAAEKKAAKAPDKEKLKKFISEFVIPTQASGLGAEALIAESDIIKRFNQFKSWAEGVAENI